MQRLKTVYIGVVGLLILTSIVTFLEDLSIAWLLAFVAIVLVIPARYDPAIRLKEYLMGVNNRKNRVVLNHNLFNPAQEPAYDNEHFPDVTIKCLAKDELRELR